MQLASHSIPTDEFHVIKQIIECARWAPSGDNTQVWRFELINSSHFLVLGHDTRNHCVYDLEGRASQLSLGILLESLNIAASAVGKTLDFSLNSKSTETLILLEVHINDSQTWKKDSLVDYLKLRSVHRRLFKLISLTHRQKKALESSAHERGYKIYFFEDFWERWKMSHLMFKNAELRLKLPEAFATHSSVIQWRSRFSFDKVPDQAVGFNPLMTRMMEWSLQSWKRSKTIASLPMGTLGPRLELDLLPGLFCSAHFLLVAPKSPNKLFDYLDAGRAVQRVWLTATQVGLQLQPEMTPLIFSNYTSKNIEFSKNKNMIKMAKRLRDRFLKIIDNRCDINQIVFVGRIGVAEFPLARSLRKSTEELIVK